MIDSWRQLALLGGTLAALLCFAAGCALDAARAWREASARRRGGFLAATALVAFSAAFLARGVEPRAGRHNEHALAFLASSAFVRPDLGAFFQEREASPRVLLSVYELAAGRTLRGVRVFQLGVWCLTAFFVFAALRLGGAGTPASVAAALLLLGNLHAVLLARSFAPDLACLLFLAAGVYAVVRLAVETDARRERLALAAAGAASFLAFTAKFEFGAIVLLGGAFALRGRTRLLKTRGAAAGAAVLAALYGLFLSIGDRPQNKLLPAGGLGPIEIAAHAAANLRYQLAAADPGGILLAGALAALVFAFWTRPGRSEPSRLFWPLFLAAWTLLIGALYLPMEFYPASHSRHHLFVLLPVIYLFGVLAGRLPRNAAAGAALAALVCAYGAAHARSVRAMRGELRTHDRELAFLLDSRRDWPAGCLAVEPLQSLRSSVLSKYFPYWEPGSGPVPACLLLYRSPRSGPAFGPRTGEELAIDALRLPVWRESAFEHRYFTDWHGPWDLGQFEALAPLPVAIGFYRASPEAWSDLAGRLKAARAPRQERLEAEQALVTPQWLAAIYHPLDASYERSVEFCYKRALAARASPDACFEEGVRDARRRGDVADEINLQGARSSYLLGLGRAEEARAAAAEARRTAVGAHYRGWALQRVAFSEEALARAPARGYANP